MITEPKYSVIQYWYSKNVMSDVTLGLMNPSIYCSILNMKYTEARRESLEYLERSHVDTIMLEVNVYIVDQTSQIGVNLIDVLLL